MAVSTAPGQLPSHPACREIEHYPDTACDEDWCRILSVAVQATCDARVVDEQGKGDKREPVPPQPGLEGFGGRSLHSVGT